MQVGCHGLVWTGMFDRIGLEHAIISTAGAGYDLLEIPLLRPDGFDISAAEEVRARHPLPIAASLAQSLDSDPLDGTSASRDAAEARLLHALDILGRLDSSFLVGALYGPLHKYTEPVSDAGWRNAVGVIRTAADRAAELGITLGLEVVNRYETNLFNTARTALRFLDDVDRANVGIHLDTYHMNIEEADFAAPVRACEDRLVYVHVGESHRGYLGSGTIPFEPFFRALAEIGYDGPLTFESFSSAIIEPDLSRALAVWRNLWDDSADLGAHANSFIRAQHQAAQSIDAQP